MSPVIPIGPYHPALEEPYKIELVCDGEAVREAHITVGFNFRAIEWLAERKNYTQDLALVERVCGICSNVHTLTFSRALEQLAGVEVPARAQHIRVIVHEAERLHSHLLWAGVAAELIGFQTLFMTCFALREKVMDMLEAVSGNRVNYAMNKPGGVTRDIVDPGMVAATARAIRTAMEWEIIPIPGGEACVRIEGPRGEVFCYVASDGSDVPLRVRIRTPTFQNMPTVALMVRGQTLADVPLIQASIDPCYSCTDR